MSWTRFLSSEPSEPASSSNKSKNCVSLSYISQWAWATRGCAESVLFVCQKGNFIDIARIECGRLYVTVLVSEWVSDRPSVLWRCWLVGRKGIRPVNNWVVGWWHGYLAEARCTPAYGPADGWCHCYSLSLASVKSSWYRLTRVVPQRGPLNGCVCVCVCVCVEFAVERRTDPCSTSPNPTGQPSPPTGQINIFTEFASCVVIASSVNYVLISPLFNTAIDRHLASYAYRVDEAYDTIRYEMLV